MELGSGYDDIISCTKVVSISTSCSGCSNFASSSISFHIYDSLDFMGYMLFPHGLLVYIA